MITRTEMEEAIGEHVDIVEKTLSEDFVMPDFQDFKKQVKELFDNSKKINEGKVADYIPELALANPNHFGVSICTIDGQRLSFGDTRKLYSVQSTSKPISYCIALELLGPEPEVPESPDSEPLPEEQQYTWLEWDQWLFEQRRSPE